MTKTELIRELYLIQHGGRNRNPNDDSRFASYRRFLVAQGLTSTQVIDLLMLATTHLMADLLDASSDPISRQVEDLLREINRRKK